MKNKVANMISTILSKRAVLAGAFLALAGVFVFSIIVDASIRINQWYPDPSGYIEVDRNSSSITTATGQNFNYCFLTTVGVTDRDEDQSAHCQIQDVGGGRFSLYAARRNGNDNISCTMRCQANNTTADFTNQNAGTTIDTGAGVYDSCLLTAVEVERTSIFGVQERKCVVEDLGSGNFALQASFSPSSNKGHQCAMECASVSAASPSFTSFSIDDYSGTATTTGGPYLFCGLTTFVSEDNNGGDPDGGGRCAITRDSQADSSTFTLSTDSGGDNGNARCAMSCLNRAGGLGELCYSSGTCDSGFACNSSNICDIPPRSCPLHSSGPEWTANYKPQSGGAAYGYATAVDWAGNVYVAGEAFNAISANSGLDMFVAKFTPGGSLDSSFGTGGVVKYDNNGNESGYGVGVDASGNVYVVGAVRDVNIPRIDGVVIKYNSLGEVVWLKTPTSSGILRGVAVSDTTSMVYATGYTNVSGNSAMVLVALRTSDGDVRWNNSQPADNGLSEAGFAVAVSRGTRYVPRIYVTGYYQPAINNTDMFFRVYDRAGASQWEEGYDSGNNQTDIGRGVAISRDVSEDTIFITGYQSTNGGDMFAHAYDFFGNVRWSEVYNSGGVQSDVGRAVTVGANGTGRVYVAGHQGINNNDTFLREYFSSDYKGFLQQALSAISAGNEMAYSVAVDSNNVDEPVYVSGYRDSNGGEAFLSKYSCIASAAGGAVTASGEWATLSVTPDTTGNAPFTVTATGNVTIPDPVAYTWDWGDGETSTGQIATHTYRNTTGTTTNPLLTLTVQNLTITSESDIATTTITVRPDTAPIAGFTVTPSIGVAPLLVRVNSTSTDTLPGKIISYNWNWGDGTAPGNGVQTSHVYTNAGTYTITLAVKDDGGMSTSTTSRIINVTWACTGYSGPNGSCDPSSDIPICARGNQCVECLADYDCGVGSRCTGTSCKQGDLCPDGNDCPIDGKCAELASDGSSVKNTCALASDSLGASCYIEEIPSSCANDLGCTDSAMGGVCDITDSVCRYARCLNESSKTCAKDTDCAGGDGICDAGVCKYIYDCAYGPGMSSSAIGRYATAIPPTMPAMPVGPQPEGQACTQPTPDAPINCQGINGCLYYNFEGDGNPIQNSNNSVANCLDKFNGGTGCVYYQYYGTSSSGVIAQTEKANCLASPDGIAGTANKRTVCVPGNPCADGQTCPANGVCLATPVTAGIPDGCIQVAKGKDSKGNIKYDYNCSNIDGCYYKADGGIDCAYTYNKTLAGPCSQSSDCADMAGSSDKTCVNNSCAYQFEGNGCIYEPNPEGAIFCPGATKPATGGENYVQCLLNPDATLPWYLQDRTATTTQACKTNADCPAGNICLDGACYPECQIQSCTTGDTCLDGSICPASGECKTNCATGQSCLITCKTVYDCPSDSYICDGVCIQPPICSSGDYCPSGDPCPLNGQCPTTPLCFGAQPRGNLPFGTNTTPISMQTTQDATCRYSIIQGTPFNAMTETFDTTGNTTHSEDVFGLMPLPSINKYFVECQTASGITPACRIEFGVGGCQAGTYCPDGNLCPANGVCPPLPYCDGAVPPPGTSLPSNTASVDIGLNTDNVAACKYSQTLPNSLLSRLDQYLGMPTLFSTIDGLTHTDTVTSNLVTGNNRYYALCQENAPPQNVAPLCQISFNIGVCNEEFKCANGWQCEPNVGNGICIPPACSNVSVVSPPFNSDGTLPAATTAVTLQAATDESANCAYGDRSSTAFSSMTGFLPTGGVAHTANNVSINGGYNTKYVKCQDTDGEDVCSVSFRVGSECGANGACPSGLECRNGACLYPICENAYPINVPDGTTETTMGLTTNTDAECRYSKTTSDFNSQAVFDNTGGQAHSTLVTDLVPRRNRYIVDCRDNALPNKIKTCEIPIYVGTCATGDCAAGYGCNLAGAGTCMICSDYASNDPNRPPECDPWCVRFPWLCNQNPRCTPGVDCPIDLLPPPNGASCSFMGITFFGDAVDEDGTCDILAMILAIISWMAWLVALLAVLSGLRAAYLYITAMGNEKRLILARSYLIYTTIGVVVAIVSFGLVAIVRALMGI